MRLIGLPFLVLNLAPTLVGCAVTSEYPADWPEKAAVESGQCPRLEGRYNNAGVAAQSCPSRRSYKWQYRWDCNTALSTNILPPTLAQQFMFNGADMRWVELHQPDNDTLVIQHDLGVAPVIFRRGDGDFSCGNGGLTISQSGSAIRTKDMGHGIAAFYTSFGVLTGTAWFATLSHSFYRLVDGSLLMEVSESAVGAYLYIPTMFGRQYFVRWKPSDKTE
jgi:hypothetical protein